MLDEGLGQPLTLRSLLLVDSSVEFRSVLLETRAGSSYDGLAGCYLGADSRI